MYDITHTKSPMQNVIWGMVASALVLGLALSIFSFFGLCTSACAEGHKYRIFSLKFEYYGIVFFILMLIFHFLLLKHGFFAFLNSAMLAGAAGAEVYFIYLQKYVIKSWCPVCLGVALTIFISLLGYLTINYLRFKTYKDGQVMKNFLKYKLGLLIFAMVGFFSVFVGTTKINAEEQLKNSLKQSIAFGNTASPIEIYIFTDWFCPACTRIEPIIQKASPIMEKEAQVFFIDAFIHYESLNFVPYNLSFMIHDKSNYFDLRKALSKVAAKSDSPTDAEVIEAIKPLNVTYKELPYKDIALATKMFRTSKKQFGISSTPTIVMVNTKTKKGKKLKGSADITEAKIEQAIKDLKKS